MSAGGFGDFDAFFEERGYEDGQEPEAFAAWLASKTGRPVDGFAMDGSSAVHAEPPAGAVMVDRFGGSYSMTKVPWRWWQRPRWLWRLGWRVRTWWGV